ncbi:MAG: hypothetical protein EAZ32_04430 [Cytophagia bacterium]|nr:MAG: hypothetical protein EAZ46_02780 [Runella sp.]TAG21797.1 MAG: hypothetical protein EAZ38_07085 [Cytophagales bacterium]TAG41039.1 MAG: hypothetical protein EAZ32_04430 [Cytophagia bacterium]TAG83832.1 MAG: hypothetical protein EAZ22_01465 [Cytophagales bacterium]
MVSLLSFDSGMVIHTVSENQKGDQANGFVINHGLNDKERELYERKVQLMQQEIEFLRSLVKHHQTRIAQRKCLAWALGASHLLSNNFLDALFQVFYYGFVNMLKIRVGYAFEL